MGRVRLRLAGAALVAALVALHPALLPLAALAAAGWLAHRAQRGRLLRTVRGARPPPSAARTVRAEEAERRAEELHQAWLETERARAQALRERVRPRREQDAAVRRAYIQGATEQAARDAKGRP